MARLGWRPVRALLSQLGPDHPALQVRDYSGRSLVLTAAREGATESVQALLAMQLDPNTPNLEGWTPLAFACRGAPKKDKHPASWLTMVESLLEAKADTTATTSKGFQPLHYACASNHPAALKALLTRGADPRRRHKDGRRHSAARRLLPGAGRLRAAAGGG